jgi:PEP-CTERM motif
MKALIKLASVACFLASAGAAQATTNINFDTGAIGAPVGSFYAAQGVTFSGTKFTDNFGLLGSSGRRGITSNTTPAEFFFGVNNAIAGSFTGLANKVSIRAINVGNAGARIDAFNASGVLIGSASDFGVDFGLDTFKDISVSANGIKSFKVYQPNFNLVDGVLFDDLSFDTALAAVPEPTTWAMLILGMGIVGGTMRRRRSQASFA